MKLFLTAYCTLMVLLCTAQPVESDADKYTTDPVKRDIRQNGPALSKSSISNDAVQSETSVNNATNDSTIKVQRGVSISRLTNCTVTTLAGNGVAGYVNNVGNEALLNLPKGVAVDKTGNVYVADAANNIILRITPAGIVSNFAGTGESGNMDGRSNKASFYYPCGIAIDTNGNIFIADKGNHKIRKIDNTGLVTTLAGSGVRGDKDGQGKEARFDKPVSLAVDGKGNIYVADQCNHKIRKITAAGVVTTLAGSGHLGNKDGNGIEASFYDPTGVAVDGNGNIYVADYSNNRIRKISPLGEVITLTGNDTTGSTDGIAKVASFYFPNGLAVDKAGNVFIADQVNNKIRLLTTDGVVYTIAGNGKSGSMDGIGNIASFDNPAGVAIDNDGAIYVADYNNHKIRKIKPANELLNDSRKINNSPAHQAM